MGWALPHQSLIKLPRLSPAVVVGGRGNSKKVESFASCKYIAAGAGV